MDHQGPRTLGEGLDELVLARQWRAERADADQQACVVLRSPLPEEEEE